MYNVINKIYNISNCIVLSVTQDSILIFFIITIILLCYAFLPCPTSASVSLYKMFQMKRIGHKMYIDVDKYY